MAHSDRARQANWIRVTLRLKVPLTARGTEVSKLIEGWADARYVQLDLEYGAVPVPPPRWQQEELQKSEMHLVTVRALLDPERERWMGDQRFVDRVFRDARIEPFDRTGMVAQAFGAPGPPGRIECATSDQPDGTAELVAKDLGAPNLWAAGYTGRGLVVGIVDGGITANSRPTQFGGWPAIPQAPATGEVIGGWPPTDWGTTAEGWGQHGNMIAFDVQAIAPEAELWDLRIFQPGGAFPDYVSNAEAAYQATIAHFKTFGVPQILVNSWGVYDSRDAHDYAFNPESALTLHVEDALNAGMLIVWAAGNCGDGCPFATDSPCGQRDRGAGASILGPNGHPRVMTVGAATIHGEWCGYTSQGPAALPPNDPDKPDFCGLSQFEGFFPNDSGLRRYDGGTSAATGIASGVVALLKQAAPDLTQEDCKRLLKETARPIKTPAAHDGAGAGIIHALRAFRAL